MYSFAQFDLINTSTTVTLEDIYFIDQNIGIAVGDSGTIIRSVDSGLSWEIVMQVDTIGLFEVGFFDDVNGIASGTHTYITSDAGASWQLALESNGSSNFFTDLEILDENTCLISNYNIGLMKSTDKGQSWETLVPSNQSFQYRAMNFLDENIGFAHSELGPPYISILKTENGGVNWDTIVSSSDWNNTVFEEMVFIDENIGFQVGWYNGHFVKTIDGGATWYWPDTDDDISTQLFDLDISHDRPNSYFACGWYGEILKSTDGGESWFRVDNGIANNNALKAVFFLNDTLGWVAGGLGQILRTSTGGEVLSTDNNFSEANFTLFPNPGSDIIKFNFDPSLASESYQIFIRDLKGAEILQEVLTNDLELDISSIRVGTYLINIQGSKGWMGAAKLIISR